MGLKIGMNTLTTSCYAYLKYHTPPTSGVGGATACNTQDLFYASLQGPRTSGEKITTVTNVGFVQYKGQDAYE